MVILTTAFDGAGDATTQLVYRTAAAILVALAALTAATGARTPVVWFRACPYVLTTCAVLLVVGSLLRRWRSAAAELFDEPAPAAAHRRRPGHAEALEDRREAPAQCVVLQRELGQRLHRKCSLDAAVVVEGVEQQLDCARSLGRA
jgi:hypothetical protein